MLLVLLSTSFLSSCDVSDDNANSCYAVGGVGTTAVTGPETADVDEEISFTVAFSVPSTCGSFLQFYQEESGNEIKITVAAKYEGCNCDNIATNRSTIYKFKATTAGVYKLIFKKTNTESITKTVTVE